jgi:hypothetical protein
MRVVDVTLGVAMNSCRHIHQAPSCVRGEWCVCLLISRSSLGIDSSGKDAFSMVNLTKENCWGRKNHSSCIL